MVRLESERAQVADEGRWIARYIGQSNGDFDLAIKMLNEDPPPFGLQFAKKWKPNLPQIHFDDSVVAYRSEKFDGKTLVVHKDLTISWR